MPSINDWAANAARRVYAEYRVRDEYSPHDPVSSRERIAAIVATCMKPLVDLLRESRRSHYHCEDNWYCCGRCACGCAYAGDDGHEHSDSCYPSSHDGEAARTQGVCNCSADVWNARVDAALSGEPR